VPADHHARTDCDGAIDLVLDELRGMRGDERPDLRCRVEGVALHDLSQASSHLLDKTPSQVPRHQRSLAGAADLTAVHHARRDQLVSRVVEVRIFEDEERVVAAHLEEHPVHRAGGVAIDALARLRAAREGHRRDAIARDEVRGDVAARGEQHLDSTLRDAGIDEHARQPHPHERIRAGRLHDHRVAHQQSRDDLVDVQLDGRVERHDAEEHAERFALGEDQVPLKTGLTLRHHVAVEMLRPLREPASERDRDANLRPALGDRPTHVPAHEVSDLISLRLELGGEAHDGVRTLPQWHARPFAQPRSAMSSTVDASSGVAARGSLSRASCVTGLRIATRFTSVGTSFTSWPLR